MATASALSNVRVQDDMVHFGSQEPAADTYAARWPHRLVELGAAVDTAEHESQRDRLIGQMWSLLAIVLYACASRESHRTGALSNDDLRDLASDKSLELMERFSRGEWPLHRDAPERVAAFVVSVARNGLIDRLRKETRRATRTTADVDDLNNEITRDDEHRTPATDGGVEREQFAAALVECSGTLRPTHRQIWMLRTFLEMTARDIGRHPDVRLNAGHVDVILQRCRQRIKKCMGDKGFNTLELPPGCFTALWRAFCMDDMAQDQR